jgi:FlaA1/EpsC-like NDP-sugar epimerase
MLIYQGATILITGICGTVGEELLSQLSLLNPRRVIGLDHNEEAVFNAAAAWHHDKRVELVLGDIRDIDRLSSISRGVDIIIHAAAYKHVTLCEESPGDAVSTNIRGTQNVIDAALRNNAQRVLFMSSDKAVNPTTVMGTTKLMGEYLMRAANASGHARDGIGPIFVSIRFGNILGSSGSVIPVFRRQIAAGGPVTLTDPGMTRFVMTVTEAARAVLHSLSIAKGGEVFVTKMPAINIRELAEILIDQYFDKNNVNNVEIQNVGARAGEKLYEELINIEEFGRTIELGKYFVILPSRAVARQVQNEKFAGESPTRLVSCYHSGQGNLLSKPELSLLLSTVLSGECFNRAAAGSVFTPAAQTRFS